MALEMAASFAGNPSVQPQDCPFLFGLLAAKAFQCLPDDFNALNFGRHLAVTAPAASARGPAGSRNEMKAKTRILAITDCMDFLLR
jgi:hypothetical protein